MHKKAVRAAGLLLGLILCTVLLPAAIFANEADITPGSSAPPDVGAEAYVVMDADTGQILISKNAHLAEYPASITKLLTLGLFLESVDMETCGQDRAVVSDEAVDALIPYASMISLGRGEDPVVQDLLYATMIASANDASHVLAEYAGGSIESFASMMNAKTAALGLAGSNFTNPSGQPDDNHYTTAYDMAHITRWALSVPGFREIFGAEEYQMQPTNTYGTGRTLRGNNQITQPASAYYCEGVQGSKTGYTNSARYTLVTTARRGDTELICVVLKCDYNAEKYNSTNALLNYCFDNFSRVNFSAESFEPVSVPVYGGGEKPLGEIEVKGTGNVSYLLHNDLAGTAVETYCEIPERYVIGQPFAPTMYISIDGDTPGQQGAELAALPMTWTGLEDILQKSTTNGTAWERMSTERPLLFWILLIVPVFITAVIAGRILHVRNKKNRRRKKRLAAARAAMPVAIEARPQPPAPPRHIAKSANTNVVYLTGKTQGQPRRAGQARYGAAE